MLLPSAACSVFAHAPTTRVGGYRFEVFHADRFTSVSYDRIEIGFRVYEDRDQARAPFDRAFHGRMHVVDDEGRTFPVIVQAMKRTATSEYLPVRGYIGIVKLGGRDSPTAATPLDKFRLVIESPDGSDRGDRIEVRLRF